MALVILQTDVSPAWLLLAPVLFLAAAAALAYVFVQRQRSRRNLERRVAELEALSQAGRALVATETDIDALCELIAEQAGQIVNTDTFQVGLFDGSFYEIRYWTVNGRHRETPRRFNIEEEADDHTQSSGIIGWVRDYRQPLLIGDFAQEMDRLPARPSYQSDSPPRSALFIPLISGESAIGVIAVQSYQPQQFGLQDLKRLTILANQAAAAIANARLLDQAQMRAAHLELVGQIAHQVNAVQDLDAIFTEVVELTRETFGFHPVNIFTVDPQSAEVVMQASSLEARPGQSDSPIADHLVRMPVGTGIVGAAAAARETVIVNHTADDGQFIPHLPTLPADHYANTQAEIAIPLIVNEELVGVLDVQSPEVGVFGPTETTVLEALAAEVAGAIYKARQLAREQEQAWVTTAQLQVAEAISRSTDLEELLEGVTRLASLLLGVDLAAVLLWDEENQRYQGATLVDRDGDLDDLFDKMVLPLGQWNTLDAAHVGCQAMRTTQLPDWLSKQERATRFSNVRCLNLLPLAGSEGTMLGMMLIDGYDWTHCAPDNHSTPPDPAIRGRREELLQNIVRQTAQGLESAHLRAAQQEEAWVNTALLQVAEAVNSLTDLNDILDSIVRLVPLLVGVDSVFILVWDEERDLFTAGPSYGVSQMGRGLVQTLEIDREEFLSLSHQMAIDLEAVGPRTTHYALHVPAWLETVMGTPIAYSFPLVARGRLVGAMIVGLQNGHANGTPLTFRRANILNGIAQQAATAVVNNQLYRESAERARMQQELDVAHEIQASFLPDSSPEIDGCTVASYWQAARQVSGDFFDFLPLDNGRLGIVVADVADKGVPAALFMALSRTILRTVAFSREEPAQVLMRANEIIGREARSDLFVTVFYGIWDAATQRFTYANGGHNRPLLMGAGGSFRELLGNGMALGVLPQIEMTSQTIQLKKGDAIIFYTDGVTEALNEDQDEFGMQRLQLAAKTAARQNAQTIVHSIKDAIGDHAGETPQFDDITLVVLKHHGRSS